MIEGLKEAVEALDESLKKSIRELQKLWEAVERAKQEPEKPRYKADGMEELRQLVEEIGKRIETEKDFQAMSAFAITLEDLRKAEQHEQREAALLAGMKSAARARAYCQGIIRVKARNAAQGRKWEKRSRDSIPLLR